MMEEKEKGQEKQEGTKFFFEVKPNYYEVYINFIILSKVMFQIFVGVFIEGLF